MLSTLSETNFSKLYLQKMYLFLQDCLRSCQEQIEQTLASNLSHVDSNMSDNTSSKTDFHPNRDHIEGQPTTPTDVQDIVF